MIERLNIPMFVSYCLGSLRFAEPAPGTWKTICVQSWECIGCNGASEFQCPVHPRDLVEVEQADSMQLIPNWSFSNRWIRGEHLAAYLQKYVESKEQFYYTRQLRADLDTIVILKVREVNVDGTSS